MDLSLKCGEAPISLPSQNSDCRIFEEIVYFVSGSIDFNTLSILKNSNAKSTLFLSDFVTHCIVGTENDKNDVCTAKELYNLPIVTSKWIQMSVLCNKLLPTKPFNPTENHLFNGIVVSVSQLSVNDCKSLWALITYNGGTFKLTLDMYKTTHLVVTKTFGVKYVTSNGLKNIKIVTPDWIIDCIKNNKLCSEVNYHPKLLLLSTLPSINQSFKKQTNSLSMITGFVEPQTIILNNQGLKQILEQLKQRFPWNQSTRLPTLQPTQILSPLLSKVALQSNNTQTEIQLKYNTPLQQPNQIRIQRSQKLQFKSNKLKLLQNNLQLLEGRQYTHFQMMSNKQQQTFHQNQEATQVQKLSSSHQSINKLQQIQQGSQQHPENDKQLQSSQLYNEIIKLPKQSEQIQLNQLSKLQQQTIDPLQNHQIVKKSMRPQQIFQFQQDQQQNQQLPLFQKQTMQSEQNQSYFNQLLQDQQIKFKNISIQQVKSPQQRNTENTKVEFPLQDQQQSYTIKNDQRVLPFNISNNIQFHQTQANPSCQRKLLIKLIINSFKQKLFNQEVNTRKKKIKKKQINEPVIDTLVDEAVECKYKKKKKKKKNKQKIEEDALVEQINIDKDALILKRKKKKKKEKVENELVLEQINNDENKQILKRKKNKTTQIVQEDLLFKHITIGASGKMSKKRKKKKQKIQAEQPMSEEINFNENAN